MKASFFLLPLLCGLLLLYSCFPFQRIKGDGDVITEIINIDDYDVLRVGNCSMQIEYKQLDGSPSLTVSVDKNIFEMYDISTENGTLRILPKAGYRNAAFSPTQFTVVTNSRALKKLDAAGSIVFDLRSPLVTENLKVDISGSGTINLNDSVTLNKLDVDLAGSGTLNAFSLYGNEFNGDIAGKWKTKPGRNNTESLF